MWDYKSKFAILFLVAILITPTFAENIQNKGGLPASEYNRGILGNLFGMFKTSGLFSLFTIAGDCNAGTKYYVYIPTGSAYAGSSATCSGITIIPNAIYTQTTGSDGVGSVLTKVKQCSETETAFVGIEAKGTSWGTTTACTSGYYCSDQGRAFDDWGCTPGQIEYLYASCSNECRTTEGGIPYFFTCDPNLGSSQVSCVSSDYTYGEVGASSMSDFYTKAVVDSFHDLKCSGEVIGPKYRICKYAGTTCPSEQTISYGCKPNPYAGSTPTPTPTVTQTVTVTPTVTPTATPTATPTPNATIPCLSIFSIFEIGGCGPIPTSTPVPTLEKVVTGGGGGGRPFIQQPAQMQTPIATTTPIQLTQEKPQDGAIGRVVNAVVSPIIGFFGGIWNWMIGLFK